MKKTYTQFIRESAQKVKKPTFSVVFGQHSLPYHEREVKEDAGRFDDTIKHDAATHDSREGHDALAKHYAFSKSEKSTLNRYSADSFGLNHSLIQKHENPTDHWHAADHEREHGDHVKALDAALTARKTPSDMHVYTGTRFNPERFKPKDHDGKSHFDLHMPAYSSTSTSPQQASHFASKDLASRDKGDKHSDHEHMLHIEVPKGSPGAYVAHESRHEHEREFLLHRGSTLSVHPTPTIVPRGSKTVALWHAKLKPSS